MRTTQEMPSIQTVPVPTSDLLRGLLDEAPPDSVTLDWIISRLDERSFGAIMLLLALLAMVPGISLVAGALIIWIAVEMILARPRATLPRFLARYSIATARFTRLIERMALVLCWLERLIRPRWRTPFTLTKSVVGVILLLLGLSLYSPFPLSNLIPSVVIMGMALAYLEKDGVMLAIMTVFAFGSLVVTVATLWATIFGIRLVEWS